MSPITPLPLLELSDLDGRTPDALFERSAPIELEIGCGRGDFLTTYAPTRPAVNFIGVERNLPILRRAANKMRPWTHGNVRLVHTEIVHLLADWFPNGSLVAAHVYFPDPWPKKRHARRRFVTGENVQRLERVLRPGGMLHLRTDHERYFADMLEVMASHPRFVGCETPVELLPHKTGFEMRFTLRGLPLYHRTYCLQASPAENG